MVKMCCVPNCTTGTNLNSQNIILYKVPANKEMRYLWNKAVGQKDQPIKCTDYVCSKHFRKEQFIEYMITGKDKDKNYILELSDKAIPSIFPTLNTQTTVQPTSDEESCSLQGILLPMSPDFDKSLLSTLETDQTNSKAQNRRNPRTKTQELLPTLEKNNHKSQSEETSSDESGSSENEMNVEYIDSEWEADDFETNIEQNTVKKSLVDSPLFKKLWIEGESEILLPGPNWGLHCMSQSEQLIVICEMEMINGLPKVFHQITVSDKLNISYFVRAKRVEEDVVEVFHLNSSVSCMSDIENCVTEFTAVKVCDGGPSETEFPKSQIATDLATVDEQTRRWVHRNCLVLTRNDEQWCKFCATLEEYFCKVTMRPFIYKLNM